MAKIVHGDENNRNKGKIGKYESNSHSKRPIGRELINSA